MRTLRATSGALLLLGCERPTAPAANAPPTATARPDAGAPRAVAPCERAADETRKVLDQAPLGDAGALPAALRAAFTGRCIPDARGGRAWALVPERLRFEGTAAGPGWWARYALVRVGPEPRRFAQWPAAPAEDEAAASATPFNLWSQPGDSVVTVRSMTAYDYDRDGSPELALVLETDAGEGAALSHAHVWTFTEGGVFLYEPTVGARLSGVRDVDGDGRPDLLTHAPWDEASVRCGSEFSTQVVGPELALHALPDGSFSGTDGAARAAARAACPALPARLVARTADGAIDHEGTARNVACARLWGVPEEAVAAGVRRECPPPAADAPCGGCEDVDLLLRWAHAAPPLTLAETAAP